MEGSGKAALRRRLLFIWQDPTNQMHLGFAGMITHGNTAGKFRIYDAEVIKKVLKHTFVDADPVSQ